MLASSGLEQTGHGSAGLCLVGLAGMALVSVAEFDAAGLGSAGICEIGLGSV